MLGSIHNDTLTTEEVHRFEHLPRRLPSGLHWDVVGLWSGILDGLRKTAERAERDGLTLASIGVDTWGVDFGLIGESGELLGIPHCHRDPAHQRAFEDTFQRISRAELYEATGIQFMWLNSLYQLVARQQREPALLEKAHRMLFMPDLLHYFLTGNASVEATIASTSQMIDARTGEWATGMLEKMGLPTQMLGPIVPPGANLGTPLEHVAEGTGIPGDVPVIAPATHDTAAAVAAVPADANTSWAYLSSGTWSLMGAELNEPCLSEAARDFPFTNEGGIDGTIRFLKNITGLWLVQETRRDYEKRGEVYDYNQLTEAAEDAEPFRTLIDTTHEPFLMHGDMPAKIAEYARQTGQPEPETVGQFVRCCLESLALAYRYTLENLERVLGKQFEVLHVVGGGGKNRLLNQMTADAIGRPTIVGPAEATATGNLLTQAMGVGDVKDLNHMRQIVRNTFSPETYQPQNTAAWDKAYERFVEPGKE
jgi:rhamnulokinase